MTKDKFNYIKTEKVFQKKLPNLKDIHFYTLINVGDKYNTIFKFEQVLISLLTNNNKDVFPLSNNEILSILKYYGVFKQLKQIDIKAYMQPQIQGMVSSAKKEKLPEFLMLTISEYKLEKPVKWRAMFVLLHEISHLLGNITDPDRENMADNFADTEIVKWQKFMKF